MIIKTHGNKSAEELWSKLENGINIRVQEDIKRIKEKHCDYKAVFKDSKKHMRKLKISITCKIYWIRLCQSYNENKQVINSWISSHMNRGGEHNLHTKMRDSNISH